MLRSENVPYLLTILIGLLSWSLTHTVDRILAKPILEYSIDSIRNGSKTTYNYYFSNLSNEKVFNNIKIALIFNTTTENNNKLNTDSIVFFSIYSVKGYIITTPNIKRFKENAECELFDFQPGFTVKLTCIVDGLSSPLLRYSSINPVFVIQKGFQTSLVKNEISIFIYLIAIWIFVIVIYLFKANIT